MSVKAKRRRQKTPVPVFENRFQSALHTFAGMLLETAPVDHTGLKGGAREHGLADFFAGRLPGRYKVISGVAVDTYNEQSPQLDVMIFDSTKDFPFLDSQKVGAGVLAAEALLASVEVKSVLTAQELEKSCTAARALRRLKPFGKKLAGQDIGNADETSKQNRARYHHSIFAFDSDLIAEDWLKKETGRLRRFEERPDEHLIDAIYVFKRGLINPRSDKGIPDDEGGVAIMAYYFALLNFLQREGARRGPTPYGDYAGLLHSKRWVTLGSKLKMQQAVGPEAGATSKMEVPTRAKRTLRTII